MLKFDSARLQTITYLPTEFQAGSFNTLDFYKETDGPTDGPTDQQTTRNIEDLVDPKKGNNKKSVYTVEVGPLLTHKYL